MCSTNQPSFSRVSAEFQPSFNRVSAEFQLSFSRVSAENPPNFRRVSAEFPPSFSRISTEFPPSFRRVSVGFQSSFNGTFLIASKWNYWTSNEFIGTIIWLPKNKAPSRICVTYILKATLAILSQVQHNETQSIKSIVAECIKEQIHSKARHTTPDVLVYLSVWIMNTLTRDQVRD